MRLSWSAFLLSSSLLIQRSQADKLDDAIANALFRASDSSVCPGGQSATAFSAVYSSTTAVSKWHGNNDQFEDDVFDMDISHSDSNVNKTWTLRVGKGGQITSFRGEFGEAIANQAVLKAPWNDLVTQLVAVDTAKNYDPAYGSVPYFIHGSGPYQKDPNYLDLGDVGSTGKPFYNPRLARDCSGNTCSYVNWGQQAHVPTPFRSDVLYYQKYRDCGNGVIEYDQIIHNYSSDSNDRLGYMNTPWTGVRTSTFTDMAIANTAGSLELKTDTINGWGDQGLRNLDTTGGFTTFTQSYPKQQTAFNPFCVDPASTDPNNAVVDCTATTAQNFTLTVQAADTSYMSSHSNTWGFPVYRISLNNLASPVKTGCKNPASMDTCQYPHGIVLVNPRNNFQFTVNRVVHWAWDGRYMYFGSPDAAAYNSDPNAWKNHVNSNIQTNDVFHIYTSAGKPLEDNLAFTMVHGTTTPAGMTKSRMRYGYTGDFKRDGTVWTTNFMNNINSQQTYYNRKYMMVGNYNDAESTAAPLVTKTIEDVDDMVDLPAGEAITLHYTATQFSATIGAVATTCSATGVAQACVGSTVPKTGSKPLYYITLDDMTGTSKVTHDPYHFDQTTDGNKRPYYCSTDKNIRPVYKLLGYFPADSCTTNLSGQTYMPELCADGICSQHDGLSGWNEGTSLETLSPLTSPNGSAWTWEQCAGKCATNTQCEFWTLQLAGNQNCRLFKDKGEYMYTANHIQGDQDPDCVPTTPSPVTPSPTPSPTASPVTPSPVTSSPTPSPTASPVTPSPVTPSPTPSPTASPVTPSPVTPSPTPSPTASPVTPSPVTPSPTPSPTASPVTPSPVTPSPTPSPTASPVTPSPTPSPGPICESFSKKTCPLGCQTTKNACISSSPTTPSPTASPVTPSPTPSVVTPAPIPTGCGSSKQTCVLPCTWSQGNCIASSEVNNIICGDANTKCQMAKDCCSGMCGTNGKCVSGES